MATPFIDFNWNWNWSEFCPTGLEPFAAESNDLLPCFQEVALQFPIYAIFATVSAYYFGSHTREVVRNGAQANAMCVRALVTIALALLPVCKIFVFHHLGVSIYATDVLIVSTECIMWMVHFGYLLSALRSGSISHRGPLLLTVIWLTIFMLDLIWLYSSRHFDWWPWSLGTVILDILYACTLLPTGSALPIVPARRRADQDQDELLANQYTYFQFDLNETHLGHAHDEAGWLSRLFFAWVQPLIAKGVAGGLKKIDDLFDLPDSVNVPRLSERMQSGIAHTRTLFWALHKSFGREFYLIGILRFISDTCGFAGPLLLGGLLGEQASKIANPDGDGNVTNLRPYYFALGLFGTQLICALCNTHFNWRMSLISMKMRIGMVSAIYRKALEARGLKDSRPEVLNLMSTDTDRIVNSCISFHSFWSIPFQLFTTLYLLYTQLGAAFIAGVIFAAALIPINRWLAKSIGTYSQGLMTAKDARLAATSETLNGVKQIKLHAWEDVFIGKINALRGEEVKFLAKRKYLDALCVYFWATTPVLMCFLTFGVLVLMGKALVASTTYTSVALLNMLIGPLNAFPWVLNGLIEAWISVKRVQELIDLPNLDFSAFYTPVVKDVSNVSLDLVDKPIVVELKEAAFEYATINPNAETEHTFSLHTVNMTVKQGDLVCIEGPVGGGKSTLISGIAAAIDCVHGEVCVQEFMTGFGYLPQSPWLQRGTIRDNIIWGGGFDEQWYKTVLYACALNEDLEALGGDLIDVGENGHALSGGQRSRVALARAVYQDKRVYLMDDFLACLDSHVSRHIIKHCLLGLLKDKTRIVVTRSSVLFLHANQIFHVEDGRVTRSDHMSDSIDLSLDDDMTASDDNARKRSIDLDELSATLAQRTTNNGESQEESREYGHLSKNVLPCYWRAVSTPLALLIFASVLLMQLSRNLADTWLAHWVTDTTLDTNTNASSLEHLVMRPEDEIASLPGNGTDPPEPPHKTSYYLTIFSALAISNSVLTLARAFLFAYGGIKAAKVIHKRLLNSVMFTKFHFFDMTPVGRILNRFSSDTYTIDDSLPFILNILLAQGFGLAGALLVSLYAMPWLGLVVVPMVPIYLNLQHRYRHASRDIKRLSSNALSPLYTHFTETLQGLSTIRTMRASGRFQRDFLAKLEESTKAQLSSAAAQKWLAMRLQLLGAGLVGGAGLLAAITSAHTTNPGLVGLSISYALSITGLLSGMLSAVAETEQELVAVERVDQYMQLKGEEKEEIGDGGLPTTEPPFGWPTQAVVEFSGVDLHYREHLPAALHNVTFKTEAFERIAVVGRTGAGKTTLVSALLRVAPLQQGHITVDCVDLRTLGLRKLRERIGVIPQEPFLFAGTVRENLDPRGSYYDSEIWHAITNCAAATMLVQSLGGLDGPVEKAGLNLSAGQKQLLCLVRALLRNCKVVCIDEGTANLDDATEHALHQALRACFKSSTVLFIAHRLKGLQRMDRVFVMDQGEIKEQGVPSELARDEQSLFHQMLLAQHIDIEEYTQQQQQ